jgi:hypothetical protein
MVIVQVDPVTGFVHHVAMGCVVDVSEEPAASIYVVEMSR